MPQSAAPSRPRSVNALLLALSLTLTSVNLAGPTVAAAQTFASTTVTDVVGRTVTVRTPVQRVILAEGRQTYIVASLDSDDPFKRVVGWGDDLRTADYDSYLKYQEKFPNLTEIPVFGSPQSGTFSVEKAVELQPDVVIFSLDSYAPARDSGLIDTLATADIPSVIIDFRQQPLETTVPSILLVGRLFGQEANAQAVSDLLHPADQPGLRADREDQGAVADGLHPARGRPAGVLRHLRPSQPRHPDGACWRPPTSRAGLFPGWSGTLNPEKVL